MLLIIKISFNDLEYYRKEFTECLKHNIKNSIITRIILFTDVIDHNLPKNNKVTIVTKKDYTYYDSIEYSKNISNESKIIYSNPFTKFNNDLFRIKNKDLRFNCLSSNTFYIFDRSTMLSNTDILGETISTPKVEIKLKVEEMELQTVIRKKVDTKQIVKPKTFLKKSNNIKIPKGKPKKAKTKVKTKAKKVNKEDNIVHIEGVVWEKYQTWSKYNKTK